MVPVSSLPSPFSPSPQQGGDSLDIGAPDLSHLSEEERQIILQVLQRQKDEERKEEEIAQKGNQELWDIERQIQERKENAQKLIGTQDDAICQICQKTKFADGIGHKCFYCQLRSCARCGGKTTSKNKNIWACSLCQKRQQILARTGKWFQQQQQTHLNDNVFQEQTTQQHQLPQKSSDFSISEHTKTTQQNEKLQRKQSLSSQQQKRNSLTRQNTLKRQQTMQSDDKNMKQQPIINGTTEELPKTSNETSKWNGQTRRSIKQQRERNNNKSFKQQSFNVQNSLDEENNNNIREKENVRKTLQKQVSNKVGNALPRQQTQQQQQHNLQQQQSLSQQPTTSPIQLQQRPSTSGQARLNESALTNQQQISLDFASSDHPQSLKQSPRIMRTEGGQITTANDNNILASALPNQNSGASSIRQQQPSSPSSKISTNLIPNNNDSPNNSLPLLKTRRNKMTITNRQQQQIHSSCPSSSDEQMISSPKQKQIDRQIKQQIKHQQTLQQQHCLPQSTSLQLEQTNIKKEEPDFSEKEMLRYIYENAHPNARRNTVSTQKGNSTTLPLFGQRHATMSTGSMSAIHSKTVVPDNVVLANRIRSYLSNPSVSWKPSTDQRKLIGHLLLNRLVPATSTCSNILDFGLKVVGCRDPMSGRLGAFVTRVRPGSIADTVGQLRAGDEVLEWNGHQLQNASPETVYTIVQTSKADTQLELIVSRPLTGDGDDFLNLGRRRLLEQQQQQFLVNKNIPHSQSLISATPFISGGASMQQQQKHCFYSRVPSPFVLQQQQPYNDALTGFFDSTPFCFSPSQFNSDNVSGICGRLEMALLYLPQKRELIISLSRAYDLLPRPNENDRNPYIKLFLLPDRSERSRRQSKVITGTQSPVWEEHFFYEDLDENELANRVLEVTLWDYDAFESHSFLGEALIDLSQAPLNNQPHVYTLLDMDDDNPIRVRLRYQQRRYSSSLTPPAGQQRSRSQMNFPYRTLPQNASASFGPSDRGNVSNREWESNNKATNSLSVHDLPLHSSRSRHRSYNSDFPIHSEAFRRGRHNYYGDDEDFWDEGRNFGRNSKHRKNICLSDQEQEWEIGRRRKEREHSREHRRRDREHRHHQHRHGDRQQQHNNVRDRRPQSATALRNIVEWEQRHSSGVNNSQDSAFIEEREGYQDLKQSNNNSRKTTRQQELKEQECLIGGGGGGEYGSDCSAETLSVNSAQSMQNRALLRQQQQIQRIQQQQLKQQSQSSNEDTKNYGNGGDIIDYEEDERFIEQQQQQQLGNLASMTAKEMKDRKKSLMTRLIPGRNGPNDANKRLGFARSEEVGIPGEGGGGATTTVSTTTSNTALAPPELIKQNSKESTDSSDNWLPILPDRPLGSFMENLGPGQVVGRQALGAIPMGELLIGLSVEQGTGLVLDIREARELKIGPKGAPASYVKAYLMEGKNCVAKAKTQPSRTRSASPSFRQKLIFNENLRNKMLQITVIGDFGRLERKIFMGVIQIALEELQLGGGNIVGWYKLFDSDSLNGASCQQQQPVRKESGVSST
uniref:Uncharacterized protein n=1 Tax=Meloidogyne enterolobii TaxID=390850 RepID=A0A6V7UK26_MELEN|nr:unnamed protein product [Meloidogyne enterolobii]